MLQTWYFDTKFIVKALLHYVNDKNSAIKSPHHPRPRSPIPQDQGGLEGGRNRVWHQKDMELLSTLRTVPAQPTLAKTAVKWMLHFLGHDDLDSLIFCWGQLLPPSDSPWSLLSPASGHTGSRSLLVSGTINPWHVSPIASVSVTRVQQESGSKLYNCVLLCTRCPTKNYPLL